MQKKTIDALACSSEIAQALKKGVLHGAINAGAPCPGKIFAENVPLDKSRRTQYDSMAE